MGVNQMTGTSWHKETLHKDNDDPRRNRAKCIYFKKGNCSYTVEKCIGSSHCDYYKENQNSTDKKHLSSESTSNFASIPQNKKIGFTDIVVLHLEEDNQDFKITINKPANNTELPSVHKECLGKQIGDKFTINDEFHYYIKDVIAGAQYQGYVGTQHQDYINKDYKNKKNHKLKTQDIVDIKSKHSKRYLKKLEIKARNFYKEQNQKEIY